VVMLWTDSNTGPDERTGEGGQRTTSVLPDSGGGSLLAEDLSPVPAGVSGVVTVLTKKAARHRTAETY
jgi:hypothetical protein